MALCAAPAAWAGPPHDAFYWLGEINKASAVVVVEQGIVPRTLGGRIAFAISQVLNEGDKPGAQRSGDYLVVEKALIAAGGPDVTRLHSGRSRQDIHATSLRLFERDAILETMTALTRARAALLQFASTYADAIVPAYTWGVQAQPVSLGHYLLAYDEALARDQERYRQAFARLNLSPLGSAALGTSSFPVNRQRLAELLGFAAPVVNSLDANQLSPADTGAELTGDVAASALTVGRLVADITAQYGNARPWLTIVEGQQTGVSSIMPQKRNPTGLARLREQASTLIGQSQTYMLQAHNVPAGMQDYKSDMPRQALLGAAAMYDALAGLVEALRFDPKRALDEVNNDYATTTELADVLQRDADVPFRIGHHFASELVNYGRGAGLPPAAIPYAEARRIYTEAAKAFGADDAVLPLDEATFRRALTAENMVRSSKGLGGPQPAEVARMLKAQQAALAADKAWLAAMRDTLAFAAVGRENAFAQLSKTR